MVPRSRLGRARTAQTTHNLSRLLVTLTRPDDAASEAYRTLRTNLLYARTDAPPKVIVVTSLGPGEGKSSTCANLGVVLAQASKNTLVLDCDMRKPAQHKFFGLRNTFGVVDVLAGERSLHEVWQEPLPGLKVVTVGPTPTNPAELVGSAGFTELLHQVRQEFDYVLMDVPPVQLFSDPMTLSAQGDGCLLVVDSKSARKGAVRKCIRSLEGVGANLLGAVLTNVDIPDLGYDRYYDTRR